MTPPRIVTRANGPYIVQGPVTIVDSDGQEIATALRAGAGASAPTE